MPPPLTISAAARLCGVDRRTLQRAVHAGRLRLDARQGLRERDLVAAGYLVREAPQDAPQPTPQPTPQHADRSPILGDLATRLARLERTVAALAAGVRPSDAACPTPAAFDPAKYRLGRLCDEGHAYAATGQTLRRVPSGVCPQCQTAQQRTRRAARKSGTRGA